VGPAVSCVFSATPARDPARTDLRVPVRGLHELVAGMAVAVRGAGARIPCGSACSVSWCGLRSAGQRSRMRARCTRA
jgi:hypothetical protein